jgi:hypothetical protein
VDNYPHPSRCLSPTKAFQGSSQRSNGKFDPTRRTRAYNLVKASFWGRGGTKSSLRGVKDIINFFWSQFVVSTGTDAHLWSRLIEPTGTKSELRSRLIVQTGTKSVLVPVGNTNRDQRQNISIKQLVGVPEGLATAILLERLGKLDCPPYQFKKYGCGETVRYGDQRFIETLG